MCGTKIKHVDNDHEHELFLSWTWSHGKKFVTKICQIIALEGIFSPTEKWKHARTCKKL